MKLILPLLPVLLFYSIGYFITGETNLREWYFFYTTRPGAEFLRWFVLVCFVILEIYINLDVWKKRK